MVSYLYIELFDPIVLCFTPIDATCVDCPFKIKKSKHKNAISFSVMIRLYSKSNTAKRHSRDRHGRDRMVVGFTTTYAISAYHQ
jgi:hypothetical protein